MMSFMPTLMQTLRMARLLTILLVPVLAACGQRQSQPQASPPPPQVTIAKPVSKMVADQDEYVGPGRSRHVNVVESDRLRRTSAFGEERKCHGLSPTSPKPQQQPFSASHGEGAHRIASIHQAQRRKLIPYVANSRLSGAPLEGAPN